MLKPIRITPPATRLLTLAEAKAHCRVDHDDDDAVLSALALATERHLDGIDGALGRALISQVWRQDFRSFSDPLRLPFTDIRAVTTTYRDADDVLRTVSASDYEIVEDEISPLVVLTPSFAPPALSQNRSAPVSVEFTTGFGSSPEDVPGPIRTAALMLVAHLYLNREAVAGAKTPTPYGFDDLISPYRRLTV